MTHLERVLSEALLSWEENWTPPPKYTLEEDAVLAPQERITLLRKQVSAVKKAFTLHERNKRPLRVVPLREAIREARMAKGLTQLDLSAIMGVTCSTVTDWEKGRYVPRKGNLASLRVVLGIPTP